MIVSVLLIWLSEFGLLGIMGWRARYIENGVTHLHHLQRFVLSKTWKIAFYEGIGESRGEFIVSHVGLGLEKN